MQNLQVTDEENRKERTPRSHWNSKLTSQLRFNTEMRLNAAFSVLCAEIITVIINILKV